MKQIQKWMATGLSVLFLLAAVGCQPKQDYDTFWHTGDAQENSAFESLADQVFHDLLKDDWLSLHFKVKDLEAYGFERPEPNLLAEGLGDAFYEDVLQQLEDIDYRSLSRKNQITYDCLKENVTDQLNASTLNPLRSAFDYLNGVQGQFPQLAATYDFFVEQDIRDYLTMLQQIPELFEVMLEYETERVRAGFGMSDNMLDRVIAQCESVADEGADSSMIKVFNDQLENAAFLTESEREAYRQENEHTVLSVVLPAYADLAGSLHAFYGKGVQGALCDYAGGQEYYQALMKAKSGYGGTAEELFADLEQWGTEYLERVQNTLQTMLLDPNAGANAYYQIMAFLSGEANTIGALTDPEEIMQYFSAHLEEYFPVAGEASYQIHYLTESMAATSPNAAAYYVLPQVDNYRDGSIYVNPYLNDETVIMDTLMHEGYPGHLYQNVYFWSTQPHPLRSSLSNLGYIEGWAVYAVSCMLDAYTFPQYNRYFNAILQDYYIYNWIVYSYCDVAVNYCGWTAEQIAGYLGYDWSDPAAREQAEYIYSDLIMLPGLYLSYGVGAMEMAKMRALAARLAGAEFDQVEYHKLVLDVGPCMFDQLEDLIRDYYAF